METGRGLVESRLLEVWSEEFARAVELFAGERPSLVSSKIVSDGGERAASEEADVLWQVAPVSSKEHTFMVCGGASEKCWSALGAKEGEAENAHDTFLQVVKQALASTIQSFETAEEPLRCGEGEAAQPAEFAKFTVAAVVYHFNGEELPPVWLGIDPAGLAALGGSQEPVRAATKSVAREQAADSPMLNRLMDLQLPVSVLLGRAKMPIRDVLKIASGTLIELDRQLGDYVDVVVHGTVVARGEIVSVKGNYGVRIKEVISRQDRIALKDAA